MEISVAVLLTVFNRKEKTIECLRRLYKQTPLQCCKVDVFLTDDGCTDGTSEAVIKEFPYVNIIKGNGNLFWNRGMYVAWEEAAKFDYDFYLWLNDDTFVYDNMLTSLLEASENKNNKAIIIGPTRSSVNKKTTYGGRLKNGSIPTPNGHLTKVDYFNGNIVLIPRSVYKELGNLDYYFTHSKGDFDYGLRANKAGIELYQVGCYLGECELHESLDKWCDPKIPISQRWKAMKRPNGMPPNETFHLEKKHFGLITALFHYCTIYIRCFFPEIWLYKKKK